MKPTNRLAQRAIPPALFLLLAVGLAVPAWGATAVGLGDEAACPDGGDAVVRLTVDTGGAPLQSLDAAISFDDANLEVLGVFGQLAGYETFWNVVPALGPDTLDIGVFTGSPATPAPGTVVVEIVFRVHGPDGTYALDWVEAQSLINELLADAYTDGSIDASSLDCVPTELTLTDETACPSGGDTVVSILVDTDGAPLASIDGSIYFDDAALEVLGVFLAEFTAGDYTLFWNVLAQPGPDVLDISLFTGTPLVPPADEPVVLILWRLHGPAGTYPLDWVRPPTLVNEANPGYYTDGSIASASADVTIAMPDDATGAPGSTVEVPVFASPAGDLHAFDLTIRFDPAVIAALSVATTPATAGFTLTTNLVTPGEVRISLFSDVPIAFGTGLAEIARITCDVTGTYGNTTPLDLTQAITDDGVTTCADDGLFEICADDDGDGVTVCASTPDCDDGNPDVYPGAPEICDGIDNQCPGDPGHGLIDEGFHADGDGIADCFDNCPFDDNANQADLDADGDGDVCDNCPVDPNPGQEDLDGDDIGDVCDCDPLDPLDSPGAEVDDSVLAGKTGAAIDLSWDDQGIPGPFRVYRGYTDPEDPFDYNHVCFDGPIAGTSVSDPSFPLVGRVFYYLISREDPCGESGLGTDSFAVPRPNDDPCTSVGFDLDVDGIEDALDNCPGIPNPAQDDPDADGNGDPCDNCPADFNPFQENLDGDSLGDVCDPDQDGDGLLDGADNCPRADNPLQEDFDADGTGDACDNCPLDSNPLQGDADFDRVGDACDNCPADWNPDQADGDADLIGDVCDPSP